MSNYVFAKWTVLLKNNFALSTKMMWESRSMLRNLNKADKKLYTELPLLVEKEHRVTKAITEEEKLVRSLAKASAKGYLIAFNESMMEENLLGAVHSFNQSWLEVRNISNSKAISNIDDKRHLKALTRGVGVSFINAAEKAKKEETEEGKKVMALVNLAEDSTAAQFVSNLQTAMKRDQGIARWLMRRAMRKDIKQEKTFINRIESLAKKTKQEVEILKEGKNVSRAIEQLSAIAAEGGQDIEKAFFAAYQIKKRDFFLMLMVLYDDQVLTSLNKEWLVKHFMPQSSIQHTQVEIAELKKKVSEQFHTISQSLLITQKKIQREEAQATPLING
jgi:hypothetical protein